ncbi:MAG: hypothetical protein M1816_000767 [Peltula sp. TS41687]|nr:MAG: hypothetical protein M1816_000767 [Peltula sp. TS41687]
MASPSTEATPSAPAAAPAPDTTSQAISDPAPAPTTSDVPGATNPDIGGTTVSDQNSAIEPDTSAEHSDVDSAFGDGTESYTTSLASSIFDYKYENGRRYNAYKHGEYFLPNDESEQDRLDLVHHLHLVVLDGALHLAPLRKPNRVLDIGTGTGIWAIAFADEHPESEVIGTDLSPIQPGWVPPNLRFEIDDAESEWAYQSKFDFIHLRTMGGAIKDIPKLLRQAFKHLNPGGWLEWQEYETVVQSDDNSYPPDCAMARWIENLNKAAVKFGKEMNIAPKIKSLVEDAGFDNVSDKTFKVPITPWAKNPKLKELGKWNMLAMHDTLPPYTIWLFTNHLGWQQVEAELLIKEVRDELKNLRIHHYCV